MELAISPPPTPVDDEPCRLAESPVWDEREGRIFWIDIPVGTVHMLDLGSRRRARWRFDDPVGSLGLTVSGKLIVALGGSVHLFDLAREELTLLAEIETDRPKIRLNDGKVGPDGAFWVGSMDDRPVKEEIGALYRVEADGSFERKADGFKVSNGLAWSPDGRRMFHSDSRGPWIDCWRFDPASGEIGGRRRIRTLSDAEGRPDGGACDDEGAYWSCGVSAGCINRFSADGELLARVAVPVPRPTMPCFGGPDLRTVFVTSIRENLDAETLARHPLSGTLFALDLGVAGAPVGRFAD